jgi:hypothetical protein
VRVFGFFLNPCRDNQLDSEEWKTILAILDGFSSLIQLNGWNHYKALKEGLTDSLDLSKQSIADNDLVHAVCYLLPRRAATLTKLDIR